MSPSLRNAVAALSLAASGTAFAAPVIYTSLTGDSSAFLTAASSAGVALSTDGYEDLGAGLIDYGLSLARTSYTITAATGLGLRSTDFPGEVIDGTRSMILFNSSDPLTFTFAAPVNAIGLNFSDLDMGIGEFRVSINGGPSQALLSAGSGDNIRYFFGAIDAVASITSVTFDRTAGDGYYFDLMRFGTSSATVAVPGTWALAGLALVAGLAARRRAAA